MNPHYHYCDVEYTTAFGMTSRDGISVTRFAEASRRHDKPPRQHFDVVPFASTKSTIKRNETLSSLRFCEFN